MKDYNSFAEIYDSVYLGTEGDLDFYVNETKKIKGNVLEIACGTGRILLPLLKKGVNIEGIDLSARMLDVLNKKAKSLHLKPKVWEADMRNFNAKKKYDLIIVPYRAFNHIETSADQIKTLKNFKKHLKEQGKLIINFFYPSFTVMAKRNGVKTKRDTVKINGVKYFRQEQIQYEPMKQLIRATSFLTDAKGQTYKTLLMHLCYIYKKEFELLLSAAGFKTWKVYGGFKGEKLKDEKQEMVWIIKN